MQRIVKHDNKYALLKIWKTKLVLDCLEEEHYKEFVSKGEYTVI